MARIVKEEEYAEKRNAILAATQRLVFTKGYEQMTIQDILDNLQISKGAFYHYFDSKQAALEGLIAQMIEEMQQLLLPVVRDPALSALEKLRRFFGTLNQWKIGQKELMLALARVWYADNNIIVRQKLLAARETCLLPLLTEIIQQGVQEGTLATAFPEEAGGVVLALVQVLGETFGGLLFSLAYDQADISRLERLIAAYSDALERVLGAPAGSLMLMDTQTIAEWYALPPHADFSN